MKYGEPKLTDLNNIGLTAFGQCETGTTADTPRCSTGTSGTLDLQCTTGSVASARLVGCVSGVTASGADAGNCNTGTSIATTGNTGGCVNGTVVTTGSCGPGATA